MARPVGWAVDGGLLVVGGPEQAGAGQCLAGGEKGGRCLVLFADEDVAAADEVGEEVHVVADVVEGLFGGDFPVEVDGILEEVTHVGGGGVAGGGADPGVDLVGVVAGGGAEFAGFDGVPGVGGDGSQVGGQRIPLAVVAGCHGELL
jgi:hypothetical protein